MTAVWVLPSLDPAFRDACLAGLRPDIRERTLVVDNSLGNAGVAASWNLGVRAARAAHAAWLVIVSESMRFGPAGGADFEAALTGRSLCFGRCDRTCPEPVVSVGSGFCRNGYGWHLVAVAVGALAAVGGFDEIFWPAWFEDADWTRRALLTGAGAPVTVEAVDAHLAACEHSLAEGLVPVLWPDSRARYLAKWGGDPGAETFARPYGRDDLPLNFTGTP